jgi:hypothetical protein
VSGGGISFSFTGLPASLTGSINVVTGAILVDPITGNIVKTPPGGAGGTVDLTNVTMGSPLLSLTTGGLAAISCPSSFDATSGSPVDGGASASLVGGACVNAGAGTPLNGPWLVRIALDGTFSPNPIPEPGTALLLASGLSGIAWAGRRGRRNA